MSHDFHEGPDDAVLYDGCAECDARAAMGVRGLLSLDAENVGRLAKRMYAVEYDEGANHYRSDNEAMLARELYYVTLVMERNPGVLR